MRRSDKPGRSPEAEPLRLEAAIHRGVQVLNAFRRIDHDLGNAELAERTGLTKPTVSRITYTLARQGYLSFDPRGRTYRLGPRAAALGAAALDGLDLRRDALPRMSRLAEGAAFNVCLGVRDRRWMVYTDVCEGDALVGLRAFPGSRLPLLTTAIGRAYLAGLSAARRQEVLDSLIAYGPPVSDAEREGVERAVAQVVAQGFCDSLGEWDSGVNGIAAPVRRPDGQVFAINLGGPAYKLAAEDLSLRHGPRLVRLARELEGLGAEARRLAGEGVAL